MYVTLYGLAKDLGLVNIFKKIFSKKFFQKNFLKKIFSKKIFFDCAKCVATYDAYKDKGV